MEAAAQAARAAAAEEAPKLEFAWNEYRALEAELLDDNHRAAAQLQEARQCLD